MVRKICIADRSAKPAIADPFKLAVPAARRHPYFNLDIRGGARLQRRRDAAKGGQTFNRHSAIGRCERARDRFSGSYSGVPQRSERRIRREVRTGVGCGCRRAEENDDEWEIRATGHESLLTLFPLRA